MRDASPRKMAETTQLQDRRSQTSARGVGPLALLLCAPLLGVLLGPLVLGRVNPQLHRQLWVGGVVQERTQAAQAAEFQSQLSRLGSTGVTDAAVAELVQANAIQAAALADATRAQVVRREALLAQMAGGLVLGAAGVLVLRGLLGVCGALVLADRLDGLLAAAIGAWMVLWLGRGAAPGAAGTAVIAATMAMSLTLVLWPTAVSRES